MAFSLPLPLLLVSLTAGCGSDRTGQARVELLQYPSCAALEADIKRRAYEELDATLAGYGPWGFGGGGDEPATDADGAGAGEGGSGGREEGQDYSGTNNQEAGVDEADLVKTDGHHIYLVNGNRLHVFAVPEFGELEAVSETEIEGQPSQLLFDSERRRAAVFSTVRVDSLPEEHPLHEYLGRDESDDWWSWRTWAVSKITILDLADLERPKLEREIWLEGWYQTARRIDSSVRLVANSWMLVPGLDDWWRYAWDEQGNRLPESLIRRRARARIAAASVEDLIPRMYERLPSGELRPHSLAGKSCRSFYYPTDSAGRGTTSIVSLDLGAPKLAVDATTVVSNWSTVYSSRDRLYLAESSWSWWWPMRELSPGELFVPATNIHGFDITSPGKSSYVGSGRVEGNVINQFALSEKDGFLRIAATSRPWRVWGVDTPWQEPPPPESHIYVLEEQAGELVTVGHVGGIAPGERIFSARFLGDRGYIVTFIDVDPLFTIDLSDPRDPRVVGELKIPGFSTYLHPIEGGRILAIGVGGDDTGANWRTQVSLFDVSDDTAPALLDAEELLTEGWGWSEAMYEHKAFQFFAPKALLAVPLSSYSEERLPSGEWRWRWSSRLELVKVEESGLSRAGSLDHSRFYDDGNWWGTADVRRSIFMGEYIYALSARALTVHRLDDLAEVAAEELPGPTGYDYWWW